MRRVLAPVLTVLVAAGLTAALAWANSEPPVGSAAPLPTVLPLPNGFSPEGIAIDEQVAYTGSVADGSIQRIDLQTGAATQLAPSPGPARISAGMDVDHLGRLWVAGGGRGFGPDIITSYRVYDTTSGALLADVTVPTAVYLNDVIATRDAAWFTDSFSPTLVRVPIEADGTIGSPQAVTLGGDWAQSAGINANGIVEAPDGRHLIVAQSQAPAGGAGLYLVPTDAGGMADARRITLQGTLDAVDGLALVGPTLYVVKRDGVVGIELAQSLTAGRVLGTTEVPDAAWLTTGAVSGSHLYVVDANFGENFSNLGNPAAAFKIVAIPLP